MVQFRAWDINAHAQYIREAIMDAEKNRFEPFDLNQEKMGEIRKMQTEFVSRMMNEGIALQQKQYALLTNIMKNQMEFSGTLFSGAFTIMNDNWMPSVKDAAKK